MKRWLSLLALIMVMGTWGCFDHCRDSRDCPAKMKCDQETGQCYVPYKCLRDQNCPRDMFCAEDERCYPYETFQVEAAGCYNDNDCQYDMYCATDRLCYRIDNWKPTCIENRDCPSPVYHMYCDKSLGRCYPQQKCSRDENCPPGMYCESDEKCEYY